MSHVHETGNRNRAAGTRLRLVLFIIVGIMVAEIVGGILSNSLALLSDAGHMLVDGLAIGLSLFALTMAARPATEEKTFGYHRVEIMAALANGILLALVSIYIFYEAYQRFLSPPEIKAPLMMVIAGIGLAANLAGIFLLKGLSHASLNIKGAFWHILGDTVSSVGVLAGGVIIAVTGFKIIDPIIAVAIGVIILWGAVRLVREAVDVLLEAAPKHIQIDEVVSLLKKIPGVQEVHDVHIWTITTGINAMSAHLLVEDQNVSDSSAIVNGINRELTEKFGITHTTLQLECERCATCPVGVICNLNHSSEPGHTH